MSDLPSFSLDEHICHTSRKKSVVLNLHCSFRNSFTFSNCVVHFKMASLPSSQKLSSSSTTSTHQVLVQIFILLDVVGVSLRPFAQAAAPSEAFHQACRAVSNHCSKLFFSTSTSSGHYVAVPVSVFAASSASTWSQCFACPARVAIHVVVRVSAPTCPLRRCGITLRRYCRCTACAVRIGHSAALLWCRQAIVAFLGLDPSQQKSILQLPKKNQKRSMSSETARCTTKRPQSQTRYCLSLTRNMMTPNRCRRLPIVWT